jgi:DNA-binding transcriptional LysR family regulator
MELRQLEYFVAVAEEASFTRAAARVHVAQPGVSAQVRRLERELGQELLDRSGRTVRLTRVGEAVLPYARAALAAVAAARLATDELAGLVRVRVAVGMVTGRSSFDLPDALADFHERHPGVEITLAEDNSDHLLASLQAGQLDMALVGLSTPPPAGVRTQVVADEPVVAAVSHDHPMRARSTIPLRAMRDLPLISLPRGTGLRAAIDSACAAAGFRPRIAFEASDPDVLARLAARGLGVAILPRTVAAIHLQRLHPIAIVRPALRGRIELAWRAEGPASPAARALIAHTRARLAPPPTSP